MTRRGNVRCTHGRSKLPVSRCSCAAYIGKKEIARVANKRHAVCRAPLHVYSTMLCSANVVYVPQLYSLYPMPSHILLYLVGFQYPPIGFVSRMERLKFHCRICFACWCCVGSLEMRKYFFNAHISLFQRAIAETEICQKLSAIYRSIRTHYSL